MNNPRTRPRVSICVPNLNTRPFLPDRFASIFAQTFVDWELLVYDSHSNDGAWEYIQEIAAIDPRVRAWQGPREGTPGSWTPCVREAIGEYVYVATSDDTMAPDCLHKLVAALDLAPDCDVAHCPLRAIDAGGREATAVSRWWWEESMFAESSGDLMYQRHRRFAPLDGILHLLGGSVFTSITQLLIRRSLFERIGGFRQDWGSVGDFNWGMRAGLVANVVHVPSTWGGWRVHGGQATSQVAFGSSEHAATIDAMIEDALAATAGILPPGTAACVAALADRSVAVRAFLRQAATRRDHSTVVRRTFLLRSLLAGSAGARQVITERLSGRPTADWLRRRLDARRGAPSLVPLAASANN